MRLRIAFCALILALSAAVIGCVPCRSCGAEVGRRCDCGPSCPKGGCGDNCLCVAKADAKKRVFIHTPPPCPGGVADCQCGCRSECTAGHVCPCGQLARCPDPDGTGDVGYWRGETFVGRWFKTSNTFRYYENGKYGPALACAVPVYQAPAFMGNCTGGVCRSCR